MGAQPVQMTPCGKSDALVMVCNTLGLVVPESVIVADETMVGWTGATNIHITYLPNKLTSRGVCMKTLCDARTRVMIGFEFVEARAEQQQKRYAAEGLSAAMTLRLTEPWHNTAPRLLVADACFGGMPTSFALMSRGIFSITNVKTHTKYFCKKELWADAKGAKMGHERNDRSYRQLRLRVNGKDTTFTGAFHMDKAPITLLGTAGSSREAPPVMRRRMYMTDDGDLVRWVGELQQPDIHYKLAVGPRSVCNVATNSLPLKLWLSLVACAETNAYPMYVHLNKLTSEQYNHSDFKAELEEQLLQHADEAASDSEVEVGVQTRRSTESVSTGAAEAHRDSMPARFQGHALTRDATKNRKCMICGKTTKTICGCGRAICSSAGGVTCWAWHLDAVITGATAEQPVQWQRGKRQRT
jgi:hypothetical protein